MENGIRTVIYDTALKLEAYHFEGIMQHFPNHFHEYYVIGFIEKGRRSLLCKGKEFTVLPGDLLLFNPRDNHACAPLDSQALDYRSLNIQRETMANAIREITGQAIQPRFTQPVVFHSELVTPLRELHLMIMEKAEGFQKEEMFFFLLEQLLEEYARPHTVQEQSEHSAQIKATCDYLENHYASAVTLDDQSQLTGLSKYHLLRSFARQIGITPYSYLETIRVDKAKKLLEQGCSPTDVAIQTGFADQSHFSRFFKKLIGLTPRQYMNIFGHTRILSHAKERIL